MPSPALRRQMKGADQSTNAGAAILQVAVK